jgi:hypothetical protein
MVVVPTDVASRADLQLIKRLQRAGVEDMTLARLQRWQKNGLLPSAEQKRVPGRRGSSSVYPPIAFQQARALDAILERHRNFDKAAILLFLHGYDVDPKTVKKAISAGLDHVDKKIDSYRGAASDPDAVAELVARRSLAEPLRTKEERAHRRKLVADAGGEQALVRSHASMLRLYLGGATATGFLTAFTRLGFDLRSKAGLDELAYDKATKNIGGMINELNQAGGLGALLRGALPTMDGENLSHLRDFIRDANRWVAGLGVNFDAPSPFLADLHHALLHPEQEQQKEMSQTARPKT